MALSVSIHHQADTAIVQVGGDIDLSTVEQLQRQITAAVDTDEASSVVIDLSHVAFMDSTGINALLKGRRLADDRGKKYQIAGASGLVRHVLDLTGVWAHLSGHAG
jgi:anti-sigma B factor antagonist